MVLPSESKMKQDMKIELDGLKVDRKLWQRFILLPERVRKGFLSNLVNDGMHDILDCNHEMLGWYIQNYGTPEKRARSN